MSHDERLQAAIDKLQNHIDTSVAHGAVSVDAIKLALNLLPHVRNVLQADLALLNSCEDEEQRATWISAMSRAGDAQIVEAILGGDS